MATNNFDDFADRSVHSQPPLFDGTNYSLWKGMIKEFLMAINFELGFVMKLCYKGPITNTNEITYINQLKGIPKEERRAMSMDANPKNILVCALTKQEYNWACNCDTVKKMWDMLQITHKGTKQVRLTNMKCSRCCQKIIEEEQVRKMPRSLPNQWTPKVIAIREAKNVSTMTMYELTGSLSPHEITLLNKK
ncbi:hypothetical protein CDL12_07367 [Handroanthus impetiginosus]|uniref:DUF4219 domain-containing protein n=1 Tax=Handroanthus impetiginosus TaxID=429701 RepID=A0A2G9HQZ6_9LAMI|nr:hypothetical protein CDL12_07367 [Handroanthus impetiginosus]